MKYLIAVLFSLSSSAFAGGMSNLAIPDRIDTVRGNGFMVYGAFGNPGNCTTTNKIFIDKGHPQYQEVYSTVLAAFMGGKKVQIYVHSCGPVGWYSMPTTTYNIMGPAAALNLLH